MNNGELCFNELSKYFFRVIWGQPIIYFAIGDHVNVSWCRSHTNASGVMAT